LGRDLLRSDGNSRHYVDQKGSLGDVHNRDLFATLLADRRSAAQKGALTIVQSAAKPAYGVTQKSLGISTFGNGRGDHRNSGPRNSASEAAGGPGRSDVGAGLTTADRQAGSFLETSSVPNLAFYSIFGFEVIGHKRLEGDGPDVWAMYRKQLPIGSRPPGT
jgi:hypothetical protein